MVYTGLVTLVLVKYLNVICVLLLNLLIATVYTACVLTSVTIVERRLHLSVSLQ